MMFEPIVSGLSFYDILCYFLIYAVLGYLLEVAYATVELGKFVNRGFLSGPWCPIYGFGVILVAATLKPVHGLLPLFIGSIIVTTLIEYVTGFVLEKFFHQKWWDYTEEPFNIQGYICLKFSLLWGISCVFVVRLVLPFTDFIITVIPKWLGSIAAFAILAVMLTDFAATVATIAGLKKKMRLLDTMTANLHEHSEQMGGFVSGEVAELREKYDELSASIIGNKKVRRLLNAFPQLKEKVFDKKLSDWKEDMEKAISLMRENVADVRENIGRGIDGIRAATEPYHSKNAIGGALRLILALVIGYLLGKFC